MQLYVVSAVTETEILLKVVLNIITLTPNHIKDKRTGSAQDSALTEGQVQTPA